MFLLGLLLMVCYIPGYTGATIPTQWAFLSLALPIALWRAPSMPRPALWVWWTFLAFATLSALWAPQPIETVNGLWVIALWGLSFYLGYTTRDPRDLYRGLALGLSVSSALAIAQWLGWSPVYVNSAGTAQANIAGLFFNRTMLGALSALIILMLIHERLWHYIPALLPGLILCGSRGGWLILACGLLSRIHWSLIFVLGAVAAFAFGSSPSDIERLHIWGTALSALHPFGWSAGSFIDVYILYNGHVVHPEYVHNDYLQLLFELGLGAAIPLGVLACALTWRPTPVLWAFAVLATFYFPLYAPVTLFLGCFAMGHSLRGFSPSSLIIRHCRPDLLSRLTYAQPEPYPTWFLALPVQPHTTHSES